jgi:hypothetical protein
MAKYGPAQLMVTVDVRENIEVNNRIARHGSLYQHIGIVICASINTYILASVPGG